MNFDGRRSRGNGRHGKRGSELTIRLKERKKQREKGKGGLNIFQERPLIDPTAASWHVLTACK